MNDLIGIRFFLVNLCSIRLISFHSVFLYSEEGGSMQLKCHFIYKTIGIMPAVQYNINKSANIALPFPRCMQSNNS